MLLKIVTLFLVAMVVMAAARTWLRGGRLPGPRGRTDMLARLRCPTCGRIRISDQPGPCARPDCEYR